MSYITKQIYPGTSFYELSFYKKTLFYHDHKYLTFYCFHLSYTLYSCETRSFYDTYAEMKQFSGATCTCCKIHLLVATPFLSFPPPSLLSSASTPVPSLPIFQGFGSGSVSRYAWIRINLSCWIRTRIQEGKNDPQK
jgi:hypothetical protein